MRISYTSRIMQAILLVVVLLAFIGDAVSAKAEINSIEASLFSQNDIADNTIENLNSFHLLAFSELAYRDWEKGQTVYENLKDDWDKPAFSPNSIASELSTIQKDYSYGNLFVSNTNGTILYKELCKDISDWVVVGTSKFPPKQLSMYQYHPGFYAVTFQGQTQNGQKTVIAFRGSTTQNKDDTINDWLENDFPFQLTHLYTDQLSLAQWYYEVCISDLEINCDDIVVTGHSLGGALATAVSMVNGVHAEVFNSASVYEALTINHPELVASHFSGVDKWNLLSHIVIGDVVSNWNNEYTHLPYVEHRLSDNSITKAHNLSTFLRYIDNGGSKGVTFLVSSPVSASPTPTAANPNDLPLFLGTSGNDDVVVRKPVSTPYNSKAVILGGDGDDTLVSACDSDDMLFGGNAANYDFLDGGKGNDKYFYYKGNGIHIIQNESGHDSVFLFDFSETDLIEFVSDESFDVVACNGMPIIYVAGTRNSKSSVDVVLVQKTSWGQEEYTLVELKKSPYRFTQPNMTLEALTHSIQKGKENTFVIEKRLTQADVRFENGNNWQIRLNYNENGLLTGYTRDSYSSEHEYHYSYAYTYNADGNLTQSQEILSGFPCSMYYYDDEGKMTGWEYWEFSWSSGKAYTCEYNASGQRIRDISTSGKDETLYFYDDLGRLVSISSRWVYGDMSGKDETTMTYDEYGNLSKKEVLSDSGLGFPSMQTFLYNYDHFPFVHVTVYSDGEVMYSCLDYTAMPADEGISFTMDNAAKFESEDGYLVKVIRKDCECNFSYEQENKLPVLDISDSENQAGEVNDVRHSSDWDYIILNGTNTAEIIRYTGYPRGESTIVIPDHIDGILVTSIGDSAFLGNSFLENIVIPDSITSIGAYAFENCTELSNLKIPDSVISIGDFAFGRCFSLKSVVIPDSVSSIGGNPFERCFAEICISEDHPWLAIHNGVLFEKAQRRLVSYPSGSEVATYEIIPGTQEIGDSAFYCSYYLDSVTIPNSVTSIGEYAFWDCSSMTRINIPDSVTFIGMNAFANCRNLTVKVVENSYAEQYCINNGLKYFSVPASE